MAAIWKQITNSAADEYEPNWSPDGKKLAFISGTWQIQGASLELVDLASGQQSTTLSVDPTKGRIEALGLFSRWQQDLVYKI